MKILIIAGEASSDCHAAALVKSIKVLMPDVDFCGLGGADMQAAGVNIFYNIVNLAVIGPVDLIKNYKKLIGIYNNLCERVKKDKPDCAILIDYPGFNLKLAKDLKKLSIPVIYYISPQIWAWGLGRIKKIKSLVHKMLVLFKFEEDLYKKEGVDAVFVGHPLLDNVKQTKSSDQFLSESELKSNKTTIGILPGSRKKEISRILPIMAEAAKLIQDNVGADKVQFVLPVAKTIEISYIKEILKAPEIDIKLIENDTHNAVGSCKVAMVASGTATLETALLGVPMAIVYKAALITGLITRAVIRIPYIGLVNVISGKKIVPEFIQFDAKPGLIADYLISLINDEKKWEEKRKQLLEIKSKLGDFGASLRTAKEVVGFLKKIQTNT